MHVLVINCGSSSVKLDVLDPSTGERACSATVERVGTASCALRIGDNTVVLGEVDHAAALAMALGRVAEGQNIGAIGHRVVHGGESFTGPARLDPPTVAAIAALTPLAPLHQPANLAGIRAALERWPDTPQVAVFDTAFHHTLPRRARTYALDRAVAAKHGLRRYGFHGPSHRYVAEQAADWLGSDVRDLRIITLHLGNGASATAVEYGRSVETSMGMTPLEGLVMGTRSGDVDPGLLIELMRREGLDADGLDHLLNKHSGLAGLSGVGNDLRDIERRAADGDEACQLALHVLCHRIRKYIGGYAAVMGGVDAIVFTAGIGENSALVRHRAAQRLAFLGARLSEERNGHAEVSDASPVADISAPNSRVKLLVVATDEARAIATDAAALAQHDDDVAAQLTIPVAVSARHIHLTPEAVETLFGPGHTLTPYRPLSQPGQFACEEKVDIIGPKRTIEGVRILGPTRPACQVEISRTDEFHLGVDAPIRNSGDVANTPGIVLQGPAGRLELAEGLICARRHIHMTPEDAERFGVKDRDVVEVALDTEGRDLIFGDVLVRVKSSYALEMHIDTDEANAAEIRRGTEGALVASGKTARLRRRNTHY